MTPRTKALNALQKLVRLKCSDDNGYCTCYTCGSIDKYSSMDGGHFLPKANGNYIAFLEEQIKPQCKGCNGFGMRFGVAHAQFTIGMEDEYGREWVEDLIASRGRVRKISKAEYGEMLADYKEQIKIHKNRIGEK